MGVSEIYVVCWDSHYNGGSVRRRIMEVIFWELVEEGAMGGPICRLPCVVEVKMISVAHSVMCVLLHFVGCARR